MIAESQRRAAKIVATTYFLTFFAIMFGFVRYYAPYLVWNSRADTVRKLGEHTASLRMYIGCAAIYGIGLVVIIAALYQVLRPIGKVTALLAAVCRFAYVVLWFTMLLDLFWVLRLMAGLTAGTPESERAVSVAAQQMASAWMAYYVGLVFYGLGSLLFACLWFKSCYVPRWLAAAGILSSLFEGTCAFCYLVLPNFGSIVSVNWYELPTMVFELGLSGWLLVRGLRIPAVMERSTQLAG